MSPTNDTYCKRWLPGDNQTALETPFSAVAIALLLLGMFMMATMKRICTNEWEESVPFVLGRKVGTTVIICGSTEP
jgi:hypothetical protein